MSGRLRSLESVLDEERRDVLALLEESRTALPSSVDRHEIDPKSTIQPVRSMLQFDIPLPPARGPTTHSSKGNSTSRGTTVRSMLDINPITSPIKNASSMPDLNIEKCLPTSCRSMLDVSPDSGSALLFGETAHNLSPSVSPVRSMLDISPTSKNERYSPLYTKWNSPRSPSSLSVLDLSPTTMFAPYSADRNFKSHTATRGRIQRTSSLTSYKLPFNSRSSIPMDSESTSQSHDHLLSNESGPIVPRRNTSIWKGNYSSSVTVDATSSENPTLSVSEIHVSNQKSNLKKYQSSQSRFHLRSADAKKADSAANVLLTDEKAVTTRKLRRRVSDANLARSSGIFSSLSAGRRRAQSGTDVLTNDWRPKEKIVHKIEEDAILESSDESESDEDVGSKKTKKIADSEAEKIYALDLDRKLSTSQDNKSITEGQYGEQMKVSDLENNTIKSTSEPTVIITEPPNNMDAVKVSDNSSNTNFNGSDSESNSLHDSELGAGISDIKRAQKLMINATPVISTPATGRCVRSIHRGNFSKMQEEARENQRRVRKYLVAIDLSEESTHALEWTIGTVLRDGDTLLAIYCIDEEVGIMANDNSPDDKTQEQFEAVTSSNRTTFYTSQSVNLTRPNTHRTSVCKAGSTSSSIDLSSSGREKNKAEHERLIAVQEITDKVNELLRRTRLQVKIVIEVIHCKSPKHLVTEVIDYVSPTLVILGSRGRSALKGVILGSFSNYLVTKSSVPVMVARKRLRKNSKYKDVSIRLANNIENPHQNFQSRALATAKID